MQQAHAIFDLDGTLADTEYLVSVITAKISTEFGHKASADDVFRDLAGLGSKAKFMALGETDPLKLTLMSGLHEKFKGEIYDRPLIPLIPGGRAALDELERRGYLLSVGSSNPSSRSRLGLNKMGMVHYFNSRVFGPDMTGGRKKPLPDIFLVATQRTGTHPKDSYVVEDNEAGVTAGHAAGAKVIALLDPRFGTGALAVEKTEGLHTAGAYEVIRNLADLPRVLPRLR